MNPQTAEFVVSTGLRTDYYHVHRGRISREAAERAFATGATYHKITPSGRKVHVAIVEKNGRFYLRSL